MAESHLEQAQLCKYIYTAKPDGECKEIEYIVRDDLVVLRGSSRDLGEGGKIGYYQDWLRNIRFCPWYSKEIGWHPVGFLKAGVAIADRMIEIGGIRRFTGHSLGGIVAQIAAAIMARRGYHVDSVVVFGSPKCGKLPSLDNIDVTLYAADDPVTRVAPWNKPIRAVTPVDSEGHDISGYIEALEIS